MICPLVFVSAHKFYRVQRYSVGFAAKTAIELEASLNTDINRTS